MRRVSPVSALALLALATACSADPATQPGTVTMKLGNKPFTLEVAADGPAREKGLMNRDSMPADHGMIFVFEKPDTYGFWMKNTKIPLDLLYVDASGKIVDVATLKPMDETVYTPVAAAKYVIELNANTARDLGLKKGTVLTLPAKLPAAR